MIFGKDKFNDSLFDMLKDLIDEILSLALTSLFISMTIFIIVYGRQLKISQSYGKSLEKQNNKSATDEQSSNAEKQSVVLPYIIKLIGILLIFFSTLGSQFVFRLYLNQLLCLINSDEKCDKALDSTAFYVAIAGMLAFLFLVALTGFFITKQFPDPKVPFCAWYDRT